MKDFYIFLDIDGVMYDWDYIISETKAGRMKKGEVIRKFKPESIQALNFLLEELGKENNVNLVISSTWRSNMPLTIKTLKDNGLQYDKELDCTPDTDPIKRGEQILTYLSDKDDFDFVIIDDEMFDFKKHFENDKIIKCEMFHSALSMEMIENFLNKYNEFDESFEIDK